MINKEKIGILIDFLIKLISFPFVVLYKQTKEMLQAVTSKETWLLIWLVLFIVALIKGILREIVTFGILFIGFFLAYLWTRWYPEIIHERRKRLYEKIGATEKGKIRNFTSQKPEQSKQLRERQGVIPPN